MSENIKEKTTKAFMVDLDSSENQSILKSSTRPSNNQAHQVNEAAKKLTKSLKTPHIILTMTSF